MADWRQIQARIRKAKNSQDPSAKLSELFQRTRDAMVAWELGAVEEKAERQDEAVRWYTIAAQRFRRADWKKKAEEALERLGAPVPVAQAESSPEHRAEENTEASPTMSQMTEETPSFSGEESLDQRRDDRLPLALGEIPPSDVRFDVQVGGAATPASDQTQRKRRRRGRRGGRGRRRQGAGATSGLPAQAFTESAEEQQARPPISRSPEIERSGFGVYEGRASESPRRPVPVEIPAPQLPSERTAHGRAGDPALASRMAQLESMLRRLLASPLHRPEDTDEAPAGPGVFLLSDSDQVTSYYVESCQTLRIGLGNLTRGNRSGKGRQGGGHGYSESGLKSKLADYLGIDEAKVSKYLKDHCVVRWIQLDDDAQQFAHFAIGVLRTPLNLE